MSRCAVIVTFASRILRGDEGMAGPATQATTLPAIRVPAGWTFAGLGAGLLLGLALQGRPALAPVAAVAGPIGTLWLRALQMTILPLVAALLFTGIVQTVAAARAGALARRTLAAFVLILLSGGAMAALTMPALLAAFPIPGKAAAALAGSTATSPTAPLPGIAEFLGQIVPANVMGSAAEGAMLPVIVFVALFALASTRLAEAPAAQLRLLFEGIAGAMMVVIGWVLRIAPLGVFALGFSVAAASGGAAVQALAHYIALVVTVGAMVLLAAYAVAALAGRTGLFRFARAVLPAQAVAISTQSSLATLPAMLAVCRTLGVRQDSADFVLPLAVTLFRATSPAMNVAVAIYAAALVGIAPTPQALIAGVAVSMLTTLGAPSLPGSISFVASTGPIALAMGVPIEPLALLVAVEMIPDVMRTTGNVTMDVAVTAAVDRRGYRAL